ncbi:MAG TPA: hypothetical protein VK805_19730 [Candidatus Baltobacteraceae bacterium]|nr:hypothetical protein [Candidatus Baltobacteraceae bacterium]
MNLNFFKSESKLAFPRCEHRSPSGRQCSQPVCTTDPRFCGTHKPTPEQLTTAELTEAAGTLSSPDEVHRFLKAVLLNRVRGRITPKEASVYSYLCQNLLRSLREIDHFQQLKSEREDLNRPRRPSTWNVPTGLRPDEPGLLWHLPRPDRSDPPVPVAQIPESATANSTTVATPVPSPAIANSTPPESIPPAPSAKPPVSILPPTPNPPFDPSHLYPFDPTLRRGSQNPDRNIPPPDEAECRRLAARRGLDFSRRRTGPSGAFR